MDPGGSWYWILVDPYFGSWWNLVLDPGGSPLRILVDTHCGLTLSGLTPWNTSRGLGGGRYAHPLIMAIGGCFHYFLLARALSLDVKGQNLKAQPSTSKNIALRAFGKISIFCGYLHSCWQQSSYMPAAIFIAAGSNLHSCRQL